LFELPPERRGKRKTPFDWRNDPMFLRNQFKGTERYGFPLIRKRKIKLDNLGLIACVNTIKDDEEYFDFGVHFFVDDYRFEDIYDNPEATFPLYSQYRFCCTPDFSVYGEMPAWRQIESVAHSRWVGAWWQSRGMKVVPTICWDRFPSFEFCFEGVEDGCIVAVATYACHQGRAGFMRGYDAMLERIQPEVIICYGEPFSRMRGEILRITPKNPRQFHRELKRESISS
jgi:hypothetical protein